MNKENMMKWVKDLKSGKYGQAKGVMIDTKEDTYCCLGLVSCVTCPFTNKLDPEDTDMFSYDGVETYNLPLKTAEWLGINDNQLLLSELNDEGMSFSEIAMLIKKDIESYPEMRFVNRETWDHLKNDDTDRLKDIVLRLKEEIKNV